jgi:hypothetical protein
MVRRGTLQIAKFVNRPRPVSACDICVGGAGAIFRHEFPPARRGVWGEPHSGYPAPSKKGTLSSSQKKAKSQIVKQANAETILRTQPVSDVTARHIGCVSLLRGGQVSCCLIAL